MRRQQLRACMAGGEAESKDCYRAAEKEKKYQKCKFLSPSHFFLSVWLHYVICDLSSPLKAESKEVCCQDHQRSPSLQQVAREQLIECANCKEWYEVV